METLRSLKDYTQNCHKGDHSLIKAILKTNLDLRVWEMESLLMEGMEDNCGHVKSSLFLFFF